MREYELNLSLEELEKRTHKDYLVTKKMVDEDFEGYKNLAQGDKDALKHLVKAAYILEKINKQLDNSHNLPFEEFLNKEIEKGNKRAELTKILYDAQKGLCAILPRMFMQLLARDVILRIWVKKSFNRQF